MFLWIIPIPPCLAIAIAIRCSVTVSMPALIIGILSLIVFVRLVSKETWFGITSEYCGTSNTSSNVIPSPIILPILIALLLVYCQQKPAGLCNMVTKNYNTTRRYIVSVYTNITCIVNIEFYFCL